MIIGIDIDDTITDTYACLFPYAQRYTIEELGKEIENVNSSFTTHMYFSNFHKWSQKEEEDFLDKYYEVCLRSVEPKMFAREIINRLKQEGNIIILITARFLSDKFDVKEATQKWLKENNIEYDKLILDAQDKVKFAKENKVDVFIDDSVENCRSMAEAQIETYMMDTIVNKNDKNDKVKRVYSWPHLYQEINKKRGGK